MIVTQIEIVMNKRYSTEISTNSELMMSDGEGAEEYTAFMAWSVVG